MVRPIELMSWLASAQSRSYWQPSLRPVMARDEALVREELHQVVHRSCRSHSRSFASLMNAGCCVISRTALSLRANRSRAARCRAVTCQAIMGFIGSLISLGLMRSIPPCAFEKKQMHKGEGLISLSVEARREPCSGSTRSRGLPGPCNGSDSWLAAYGVRIGVVRGDDLIAPRSLLRQRRLPSSTVTSLRTKHTSEAVEPPAGAVGPEIATGDPHLLVPFWACASHSGFPGLDAKMGGHYSLYYPPTSWKGGWPRCQRTV